MFHDTFAVELGLAGAPIDKASLSFATRQCQTHGALCSSTVHGHGPDATRMRPGCDPDTTRTRPGHDPDAAPRTVRLPVPLPSNHVLSTDPVRR
jgi:hypothetical protein